MFTGDISATDSDDVLGVITLSHDHMEDIHFMLLLCLLLDDKRNNNLNICGCIKNKIFETQSQNSSAVVKEIEQLQSIIFDAQIVQTSDLAQLISNTNLRSTVIKIINQHLLPKSFMRIKKETGFLFRNLGEQICQIFAIKVSTLNFHCFSVFQFFKDQKKLCFSIEYNKERKTFCFVVVKKAKNLLDKNFSNQYVSMVFSEIANYVSSYANDDNHIQQSYVIRPNIDLDSQSQDAKSIIIEESYQSKHQEKAPVQPILGQIMEQSSIMDSDILSQLLKNKNQSTISLLDFNQSQEIPQGRKTLSEEVRKVDYLERAREIKCKTKMELVEQSKQQKSSKKYLLYNYSST